MGDVLRSHTFDRAILGPHVPGTAHQLEVLEDCGDGFQVVIGVHVQHRVVFVVELAMRFGAGVVALDQVLEVLVMALQMAIGVHRHKTGVLQKTRIDTATGTWKVGGNTVNHVVFKPLVAFVHGQVVHRRGRLRGVNRATHHGHAQGQGFTTRSHQRNGCQHRHSGLTHADHMTVAFGGLNVPDELLDVVDVVVEVEFAFAQRHQAGIFPVGDVDTVVLHHGAHGVSQQGGIVA